MYLMNSRIILDWYHHHRRTPHIVVHRIVVEYHLLRSIPFLQFHSHNIALVDTDHCCLNRNSTPRCLARRIGSIVAAVVDSDHTHRR